MDSRRMSFEGEQMTSRFPGFALVTLRNGSLAWKGTITTMYGNRHEMVAVYPLDYPFSAPKIFPLEPLRYRTPHTFNDGSICTHLPQEWSPNCTIVTAIGWAAAWFHAYDVWRATGDWVGKQHN